MALKIIRAGAEEYGATVKMLLCGNPGAGKTRHPSCWPNPLFLSAEGGLMSVADRQVPAIKVTAIAQVNEALQLLRQSSKVRENMLGVPVDTVVIDTIDEVWRICMKERLTEKRQEEMQQADWGYCGDLLRTIVRNFRNLDMNVIFTCHIKETKDEESGRVTVRPQVQGAMGDEIPAYVDLAVLLTARPATVVIDGKSQRIIKRTLQTYPDVKHPWIKDRSGRLPMDVEVNFNDDYDRIHAAIHGGSAPQASVVVKEAESVVTAAPAAPAPPPAKKAAAVKKAPPPQKTPAAPKPAAVAPTLVPEAHDLIEPDVDPGRSVDEETGEVTNGNGKKSAEPAANALGVCDECSKPVESVEQWDLSFIRFRTHLCRLCFRGKQPARK